MQQPSVKRGPGRPRKVQDHNSLVPVAELITQQSIDEFVEENQKPRLEIPEDWNLGALLNVRNNGAEYLVSLFPEEYDPRQPERTLRFANSAECQNFVSAWYSRTYTP
jgi:hypothetical protein